jgi:hypothetical protein
MALSSTYLDIIAVTYTNMSLQIRDSCDTVQTLVWFFLEQKFAPLLLSTYQIRGCCMIYLLTAVGLKPDGSSTVHIYTQTIHRIFITIRIHKHKNKNIIFSVRQPALIEQSVSLWIKIMKLIFRKWQLILSKYCTILRSPKFYVVQRSHLRTDTVHADVIAWCLRGTCCFH